MTLILHPVWKQEYELLLCHVWTINQEHRMTSKYNSTYSMDKTFLLHDMFIKKSTVDLHDLHMLYVMVPYAMMFIL